MISVNNNVNISPGQVLVEVTESQRIGFAVQTSDGTLLHLDGFTPSKEAPNLGIKYIKKLDGNESFLKKTQFLIGKIFGRYTTLKVKINGRQIDTYIVNAYSLDKWEKRVYKFHNQMVKKYDNYSVSENIENSFLKSVNFTTHFGSYWSKEIEINDIDKKEKSLKNGKFELESTTKKVNLGEEGKERVNEVIIPAVFAEKTFEISDDESGRKGVLMQAIAVYPNSNENSWKVGDGNNTIGADVLNDNIPGNGNGGSKPSFSLTDEEMTYLKDAKNQVEQSASKHGNNEGGELKSILKKDPNQN